MRSFIFDTVRDASIRIGVESVILHTASNLTLPKPRIEVDYLPDSYIPTGRKIARYSREGKQVIVNERYEIDSPVMLYIIDNNDTRIERLSRELVMAFPKGLPDEYNNYVRIRASQAEWAGYKAPTLGAGKRIEPIKERTFSVRVGFMWRLTYEQATECFSTFHLNLVNSQ